MRNSFSSIAIVVMLFSISGVNIASAGKWCDAAIEQAAKPQSANPAAGNPYYSGAAGATIGSAAAQILFCALDW